MLKRSLTSFATALILAGCTAPSRFPPWFTDANRPASPLIAENRVFPYDAQIPACQDPAVFDYVASAFKIREEGYWSSPLELLSFERVHEYAFRPKGPTFIPRRFCSGEVLVSDGRPRHIDYAIEEGTGRIGWSWGVTWCIVGLDRDWTYNPACKMARP